MATKCPRSFLVARYLPGIANQSIDRQARLLADRIVEVDLTETYRKESS